MARHNNFDALRLLGSLLVLLSHMAALSGRTQWTFLSDLTYGTLGVLLFFSISGHLITASWKADPDLGRFLAKRFLRMAPGLAVAVGASYLVVRALGLTGFPGNAYSALNGSLWTIKFEVYCYLLLAGAALLCPRPALAFAAVMVCGYFYVGPSSLTNFALFFAVGGLLHEYAFLREPRMLVILIAAGAAYLLLGLGMPGLALIVPALSVWIGSQSWPGLREAGRYGDLSYGIYIYAFPVQQVIVYYMPRDSGYFALLWPSLAITTSLAWLSWRYVEAPALGRKPARPKLPDALPVTG